MSAYTLVLHFEVDETITSNQAEVFSRDLMEVIYGNPSIKVNSLTVGKDEVSTLADPPDTSWVQDEEVKLDFGRDPK
jgi:hypothetical protein